MKYFLLHRLVTVLVLICFVLLASSCGSKANKQTWQETMSGMRQMVSHTEAGRIAEGEKSFNRIHDFFHAVDPALRRADRELGESLWNHVIQIEIEYARGRDPEVLAREGKTTLELLLQVGKVLGWE